MMDPKIKAIWVAALRSGQYQQTQKTLKDAYGMCCLGVLCHVTKDRIEKLGYSVWENDTSMALTFTDDEGNYHEEEGELIAPLASDFSIDDQITLIDMNDGNLFKSIKPHSFTEIADWIEQNL